MRHTRNMLQAAFRGIHMLLTFGSVLYHFSKTLKPMNEVSWNEILSDYREGIFHLKTIYITPRQKPDPLIDVLHLSTGTFINKIRYPQVEARFSVHIFQTPSLSDDNDRIIGFHFVNVYCGKMNDTFALLRKRVITRPRIT